VKARTRTALGTLALLAAAAGALLWVRQADERAEGQRRAREAEGRVFDFAAAEVRELTVEARGDTTRLVRDGAGWRIPALEAAADRAAADALAERLAGAPKKGEAAPPPLDAKALAGFGLARPAVRVQAALAGGRTASLALGDPNPFDGSRWARAGDGPVLVVPGDLAAWLEKGTFDLRDKRLMFVGDEEGTRVEVSAPGHDYALVRQGDAWRLAAPVAEPADPATAGAVISALRGLRALGFEPLPAGGAPPPARFRVKVVSPVSGTHRLAAGAPPAGKGAVAPLRVRADERAEVALAPAGGLDDLAVDLFALRDKLLLRFARGEVTGLAVEAGGAVRVAADRREAGRDGAPDAWAVTAPRAGSADPARLGGILHALATLRAAAPVAPGASPASLGLAPAGRTVLLRGAAGEVARLEIGREQGGRTAVRSGPAGRPAWVETADLAVLPSGPADLEPPPLPPSGGKAEGK
jgi:hypothetical protein